jgi:isoquinoline 1-oxidoreductase subunit beta
MIFDALAQRAARHTPATTGMDRRSFIKLTGSGAFALAAVPAALHAQDAAAELKPQQLPGPFVSIAADGSVTVQVNRLEFGQGVHTSLPMLVAEEMDADWSKVRGALAPAGVPYFDPNFGMQMTGGSNSIRASWMQYREIGARARAMLVAAAAKQWNVDPARITVASGVVQGPGGQKAHFGELAQAAMQQPVPQKVALKSPADFKLLGQPQPRKNARDIVRGRQAYGIDYGVDPATKALLPGLLTVLVARPPVFGAKVAKFDADAAKAVKGVVAVLEVPTDRGGRGVAVVAKGYWAAKQGREALKPDWNLAGVERVDSTTQLASYKALAAQPGLQVKLEGRPAAGTAAPVRTITAEYSFPYLAHAPMEPLNCVIEFNGEACRVWAGTQFQTVDQGAVAATLGLKPEQVHVQTLMAGGGFGRRAVPSSDYLVEAAQIAKAWKASGKSTPLKVMWSREDDIKGGYYRPAHVHRAEIGLAADGQVQSWQHRIVGQSIVKGTPFEAFIVKDGVDGVTTEGIADTAYQLPLSLQVHHPQQNVPVLWWRSVGNTHTAFVMETLVDEIASASKQDPVALRKALWQGKHPRHLAALELAVAKSGYGTRTLPAGRAWGVAVHESFGSVVAFVVEASVGADKTPRLHKATAGVHCNFAVNPLAVQGQVQGAALMGLGMCLPGATITLKDGVVEQSNFHDYQVARLPAMPVVDVHIVPSTEPPTGMGEPGLPPLAPAFANAIARLTGQRLRELPFKLA